MHAIVLVDMSIAAVTNDRRETELSPESAVEEKSASRTDSCCRDTAFRDDETQAKAGDCSEASARRQAVNKASDRLIFVVFLGQLSVDFPWV